MGAIKYIEDRFKISEGSEDLKLLILFPILAVFMEAFWEDGLCICIWIPLFWGYYYCSNSIYV